MWDAFTDKESGRVYYQNNQTQEVTWDKPANMAIVEMVTKPPAESMGVTVGVDASSPKLKSSRGNVLSGKLACLCCVVFLGLAIVVILVLLFAVGYGHFTPPCVGIESIQVGAIDIDFLSVLSGSPKGTVGLDVTLQLNNTNPFGIMYKQNKQGLISHGAQQIGFFTIPDGTIVSKASSTSKIAATLRAGPDGLDMATATAFMGGNKVTIGFSGEISAVGWLDSAPAIVGFQCNATVTGLSGAEAEVDCYAQYVIKALNEKGSASVTHEEMQRVNTACYV